MEISSSDNLLPFLIHARNFKIRWFIVSFHGEHHYRILNAIRTLVTQFRKTCPFSEYEGSMVNLFRFQSAFIALVVASSLLGAGIGTGNLVL